MAQKKTQQKTSQKSRKTRTAQGKAAGQTRTSQDTSQQTEAASQETLSFQAEVSRLLEIVANALYSNKDVFLRELISNASDACDRLRYAAITQPELAADDPSYRIRVHLDHRARSVVVEDNGIGMNRDDLVENLGTIARSGTLEFVRQLEQAQDKSDVSMIGQFGVGFYAAFVVADRVEVGTRKAGEGQGWRWTSAGSGEFTVEATDDAPARGTRVSIHLKKDEKDYLDEGRIKRIVQTYSDHIAIPILLGEGEDAEQLNTASALWTRPKSEITEQQYTEFYHHVAHAMDDPWTWLHFKAEGMLQYTGLLYIPTQKPFDLFDPSRQHRVKLYVRRVFITEECEELVPAYLRFLRGVVDSEDLPLNISREVLQHNPTVAKIRRQIVKRVLGELKKKAEKEPEAYAQFWDTFGAVLKEGLYEDAEQRDALLELARFRSSERDSLVSLAEYVERMKPGQEAIYFITGDDLEGLRRSPHLEGFRAKGVEVLLMHDPVDDFWVPGVGTYQEAPFKSVTRGAADLDKIGTGEAGEAAQSEETAEAAGPGVDSLVAFLKLALEGEVKDVRTTDRLSESACCLVADEGDMDIHLERLLRQHGQLQGEGARRILELNPRHALISRLAERLGGTTDPKSATAELNDAAYLLLDQARILEGETLPDPAAFARRLSQLVAKGLAGPAAETAESAAE